ncbi:nucleotide kinase domain-containing protein [Desulfovibrio aminophilus]|uniref:nucleotide kinase domain-containing protein n=1 Tax=Desulfovibrio aminophilus TaxID=81425 RepID=UPI003399038D
MNNIRTSNNKDKVMISTHQGKLYVFEGPDNVGKTTISRYIAERISISTPCKYLSFPGNTPGTIGKLIYEIHHNKRLYDLSEIDSTGLQALHIAAHIDCINRIIKPLLNSGTCVILDRFWWSTLVYGKFYGADTVAINKLIEAENTVWGCIQPDCIFYIVRGFAGADDPVIHSKLVDEYEQLYKFSTLTGRVRRIVNTTISDTISFIINEIFPKKKSVKTNGQGLLLPPKKAESYSNNYPPSSLSKLLGPSVVFDTYWKFAAKRQDIFFARLRGDPRPWTDDSILLEHKFTNAYRASDRVSQYLIKNVIYDGDQDIDEVFFRIILFKLFNKIETWELLKRNIKEISYSSFNFDRYDKILTNAIEQNNRIYSAAYIMPTGGRGTKYKRKHRMHLDLLQQMMHDKLPNQITNSKSMGNVFELLLNYPGIGDFLAYQFATDINYSELTNFPETQFVVPGPGAKDGIKKCFTKTGGLSDTEIIKIVMDHQEEEFERLGIEFKSLWGRPLKLIDCQNLFCETDKYARVKHPDIKGKTGRTRIKQKFSPNPNPIDYWYPPKWGINELIETGEQP